MANRPLKGQRACHRVANGYPSHAGHASREPFLLLVCDLVPISIAADEAELFW